MTRLGIGDACMLPDPIHDCPRCGSGPRKKAGRYRGRQRLRCERCGHTHVVEDRERRAALTNHPTPPCPSCGHPEPSRNGIDYRYEKQAYHCPACGHTFRVQLTRFAPVDQMDAMFDATIVESHRISQRLIAAGAFMLAMSLAEQQVLAKRFAASLAGELYLTRIGQASHRTLEEAVTASVAAHNRDTEPPTTAERRRKRRSVVPLGRILFILADEPRFDMTPIYSLDKTAAMRGPQAEATTQAHAGGHPGQAAENTVKGAGG